MKKTVENNTTTKLLNQNKMKLYTEHDIKNAFNSGRGYGLPDDIKDFNSFIQSITPISLLSNEEITELANEHVLYNDQKRDWVIEGMKLYREHLKQSKKN